MTPRVQKSIQAVGFVIVIGSMAAAGAVALVGGDGVPTWVKVVLGVGVAVIVVPALIPVRNR
jgi:hypothetical protein